MLVYGFSIVLTPDRGGSGSRACGGLEYSAEADARAGSHDARAHLVRGILYKVEGPKRIRLTGSFRV